MGKYRILFVEDDARYRNSIVKVLTSADYIVDSVGEAIDAIELFSLNNYDLVITDLMMDAIDGMRFLEYVRKVNKTVRTMILTANPTMDSELMALNIRVDKYLSKEVRVDVLLRHIDVLLTTPLPLANEVVIKKENTDTILYAEKENIELNLDSRTVKRQEEVIPLTPKEFGVLRVLLENKGKAVSRYTFIDEIWDSEYEDIDTRVIDVHIKTLRRKLKMQSIVAIRGFGYKWEA